MKRNYNNLYKIFYLDIEIRLVLVARAAGVIETVSTAALNAHTSDSKVLVESLEGSSRVVVTEGTNGLGALSVGGGGVIRDLVVAVYL